MVVDAVVGGAVDGAAVAGAAVDRGAVVVVARSVDVVWAGAIEDVVVSTVGSAAGADDTVEAGWVVDVDDDVDPVVETEVATSGWSPPSTTTNNRSSESDDANPLGRTVDDVSTGTDELLLAILDAKSSVSVADVHDANNSRTRTTDDNLTSFEGSRRGTDNRHARSCPYMNRQIAANGVDV